MTDAGLALKSPAGRWVLIASVLGSGMAMLDATVVNIALPVIGRDLDTTFANLQWVLNAYTLMLAGFLLLGGALGDRFGRKRLFLTGVVWFALASMLCAVAPSAEVLIAARALQGVGAALMTPNSLALLEASFSSTDRAAAIGAWSGLGGVMTALGPFVGGWLIQAASWRWIFFINVPFAIAIVALASRHLPESADANAPRHIDARGAALAVVGLAGLVNALIAGPERGWTSAGVLVSLVVGVACLVAFVASEARSAHPLLPLGLFSIGNFRAANLVTLIVYAALTGATFLLPIQLQTVVGYSALAAGVSLLPLTVIMLLFSARAGRLATRIGPRIPMALGPVVAGIGVMLLARIGAGSTYFADVFPAVVVFGAGLALTVAPLTATALGSVRDENAGIASAVNSDVARIGGLIAVAILPVLAGISNADFNNAAAFSDAFHTAMFISGFGLIAGGVLAWFTVRAPEISEAVVSEPTSHCALDATPLRADCVDAA
ncbi:MAG TPA: DHA2 family efflux MFS transporter permease subunit [Acidimicrobiia bacterium]